MNHRVTTTTMRELKLERSEMEKSLGKLRNAKIRQIVNNVE